MGRDMDQLGAGAEDGAFVMGPNRGLGAQPIGSDQVSNGLMGIEAGTGRLFYASSATGDTGIMGVTGLTGSKGSTGIMGLTGLALGATGIQGLVGETGIQGLVGETGIQGLGETGIQGLVGETGIQGLNSTSDPWTIAATLGSISGFDSTGGFYIVDSAGHTGIVGYYYNA